MSRRYTAKCWMGQKSGYVDMEVGANTSGGAREQLINVYGAETVVNLREIREGSGGGGLNFSGGSGGTWLVGLLGGGALLLYFTPWILMTAYGAGATWLTQKIVGLNVSDFADNDDATEDEVKRGAAILIAAIVFGDVN